MLYDNAALARVYLHAFQLFGDPAHERVVRETLTYLEREMLHEEGGFYSAQDADSEGIEGKFFLWTTGQIEGLLGDDADAFNQLFGVTPEGNFYDPHNPELIGPQRPLAAHRPRPRRRSPPSASRAGAGRSSRRAPGASPPRPTTRC